MYNLIYILTSWWNFYIIKGGFMSVTCYMHFAHSQIDLSITNQQHETPYSSDSSFSVWDLRFSKLSARLQNVTTQKNYNINNLSSESLTETYGDSVS